MVAIWHVTQVPRIGRAYVKPKDIAFTGALLPVHSR